MTRTLVVVAAVLCLSTPVHADVSRGDTGPEVRTVQEHLRWYGYVGVKADSRFGPVTERAVKHWQRSNGLTPDGVVDDITAASLGIRGEQITITQPPAPPALTGCDLARHHRVEAGLPDRFDALIYRESRCSNTAISRTGCCVGALQLHHIIFRDHRMIDRLATCGATWANVRGDDQASWQRQMCAARALYDVMGEGPWRL